MRRHCSKRGVVKDGRYESTSCCSRSAAVERDGQWWCSQHDPGAVAARRAERDARWAAEARERTAKRNREARISAARDAVIAAAREQARAEVATGNGDCRMALAVRALDEAEAAPDA